MIVLGTIITHFSYNKKLLRELTASSAHISPSFPVPRLKEEGKLSAPSAKCKIWKHLRYLSGCTVSAMLNPHKLEGWCDGMGSSLGKPLADMEEFVQRIKNKTKPEDNQPYNKHFLQYPEEKMALGRAAPGKLLSSSHLSSVFSSRFCNNSFFFSPLLSLWKKSLGEESHLTSFQLQPEVEQANVLKNPFPEKHSDFGILDFHLI